MPLHSNGAWPANTQGGGEGGRDPMAGRAAHPSQRARIGVPRIRRARSCPMRWSSPLGFRRFSTARPGYPGIETHVAERGRLLFFLSSPGSVYHLFAWQRQSKGKPHFFWFICFETNRHVGWYHPHHVQRAHQRFPFTGGAVSRRSVGNQVG